MAQILKNGWTDPFFFGFIGIYGINYDMFKGIFHQLSYNLNGIFDLILVDPISRHSRRDHNICIIFLVTKMCKSRRKHGGGCLILGGGILIELRLAYGQLGFVVDIKI